MNNGRTQQHRRRIATNVSLDRDLVAEARELGVNISKASASGLADAVAKARADHWIEENREALESSNAFVKAKGLPLHAHRQF